MAKRIKVDDPNNYPPPDGGGCWDLTQDENGQWWCVQTELPTVVLPTKERIRTSHSSEEE